MERHGDGRRGARGECVSDPPSTGLCRPWACVGGPEPLRGRSRDGTYDSGASCCAGASCATHRRWSCGLCRGGMAPRAPGGPRPSAFHGHGSNRCVLDLKAPWLPIQYHGTNDNMPAAGTAASVDSGCSLSSRSDHHGDASLLFDAMSIIAANDRAEWPAGGACSGSTVDNSTRAVSDSRRRSPRSQERI